MQVKLIEIRDSCTYIPVLAIRPDAFIGFSGIMNSEISAALGWVGYNPAGDNNSVTVLRLSDSESTNDPYNWGNSRTMTTAHKHIVANFDKLGNFDVVDVEFILGETKERKPSYYDERQRGYK